VKRISVTGTLGMTVNGNSVRLDRMGKGSVQIEDHEINKAIAALKAAKAARKLEYAGRRGEIDLPQLIQQHLPNGRLRVRNG